MGSVAGAFIVMAIASSGLILAVLVLIVALSLMVIEESPEAYAQCKMFMKAIQRGSNFGEGDIKLLKITKKALPRLSIYYLSLAVFLLFFAAALPYVWLSAITFFSVPMGLAVQASAVAGIGSWLVAAGLYAILLAVVILFVKKARNRVFGY
jgi:hypothetical protein